MCYIRSYFFPFLHNSFFRWLRVCEWGCGSMRCHSQQWLGGFSDYFWYKHYSQRGKVKWEFTIQKVSLTAGVGGVFSVTKWGSKSYVVGFFLTSPWPLWRGVVVGAAAPLAPLFRWTAAVTLCKIKARRCRHHCVCVCVDKNTTTHAHTSLYTAHERVWSFIKQQYYSINMLSFGMA